MSYDGKNQREYKGEHKGYESDSEGHADISEDLEYEFDKIVKFEQHVFLLFSE